MKPQFQRGNIILVRFPFTDLSGSKRRPALVLADYPPDVIVAFISSVLPGVPDSADVLLHPTDPHFSAAGLKKASVIRLRKLATLEHALITRKLGRLDQSLSATIDNALINGLKIDTGPLIKEEHQRIVDILNVQGEKAVLSYIQSQTA